MADWWRSYIRQGARKRGLDPGAVLAIAAVEGLGGGVGDQGTSFGPFQLHRGGALPAGRDRAWAESPAGLDYALNRISGVARGLHGQQAISAISRRFERPADPGSEIAKASALYGRVGGGGSGVAGPGLPSLPGSATPDLRGQRANVLAQLIASSASSSSRPDYSPLFEAMHGLRQAETAGSMKTDLHPQSHPQPHMPAQAGGSLAYLRPLANEFGLTIESTTEGKHVAGSYHYKRRAVDYGGPPGAATAARMMALMQYALRHPGQFVEAFYDPAGAYVKNGKVYKGAIGGHSDHVHLAR